MATIHEDDIKRIALGFLRNYYKHRPRSGDMRTETNLRGEGGIIVDSYLSFSDEMGNTFIAAAEATSVDTRDEVKFSVQYRLLFWDSIVFGIMSGFIYTISTYFSAGLSIPGLPPPLRIVSILLIIIAFAVLYHGGIRPLRRYRYIYAIAQFKKYHADEQWVALAKGVFPLLDENRYYRELKRQCIRFGFGLILVDKNLQPRLVLSPSREEQFERRRTEINLQALQKYISLEDLRPRDWKLVAWWNKWTNPYREHDYLRFKSGFRNQLALIVMGLLLISMAYWQEYQRLPIYFPNESSYLERLGKQAEELEQEVSTKDPKPFVIPFGEEPTEEQILGLGTSGDSTRLIPVKPEAEVMIYDPFNQTITLYDCERMYNFTDTKYIIEIGVYSDLQQARSDLEILGDAGLNAVVFWEGCFSPNQHAFIMYLETMHNDRQGAERALDSLQYKIREAGLSSRLRPVSPLINRRF